MTFIRQIPNHIVVGLLLLASAFAVPLAAQSGSVDLTFNAVPSDPLPSTTTFEQVIQPDGKILIYRAPAMFVGGELRTGMFRLNADGSFDPSFNLTDNGGITGNISVKVAPDGKIVVAGTAAPNHAKMIRLNPNGSLDNSFSVLIQASGPPEFTSSYMAVNAIQPDNKIIATYASWANISGTWYSYSMRRYNVDASIDSSFSAPALDGGHLVTTSSVVEVFPDGRFYLAVSSGSFLGGSVTLSRRFADGSVDPAFTQWVRTFSATSFLSFSDLAIAGDGGVLATGGLFQTMPGPGIPQLFKFLPNGSNDGGFVSPNVISGKIVHQLPDGKVLYSATGGSASRPLLRLATNGSVDATYVLDPAVTAIVNTIQFDSMNRPVFLADTTTGRRLVRLTENGSLDPTFSPSMGAPGVVNIVAPQPDGKVLVAGTYAYMNGVARGKISRVNPDGTLDPTFDPGTGLNNFARQLLVQPDGKILVVGAFASYNGVTTGPVLRLNTDGTLDNSFGVTVTGSSSVDCVALQPDGKILIGGGFTGINGTGRIGIARLDAGGGLDTTFNPVLGGLGNIKGISVESNGKIVIGGAFTSVNGDSRSNLARVESTGATDLAFTSTIGSVSGLYRQSDGKYLVIANAFAQLARRNSDGSTDGGFAPPTLGYSSTPLFLSVLQLSDGSILIGGRFDTVNGLSRRNLTRLKSNGAHVTSFMPNGANGDVGSLQASASDKVLIGGAFTSVDTASRVGVARLNIPALQLRTRFDFDGDARADVTVYRPSSGVWYQLFSSGNPYGSPTFGLPGDIPTPADFDGDGRTDLAIYRPSTGYWWYNESSTGLLRAATVGQNGDVPLPSDINGDGTDDYVVFRPSNNTWYWTTTTGVQGSQVFAIAGDIPVIGDFDGDGRSDRAIFRPSNGDWWYAASGSGGAQRNLHWGATGDVPAPADFDGDGKTDIAVFRPSNGAWYIFRSGDLSYTIQGWGLSGDRPTPADYDGDGKADIAVFRPSDGIWYVLQSTGGNSGARWGIATDIAVPSAFIP